jgi:dUTP pyrophosphatase
MTTKKLLLIMRGAPGCGKSSLAESLKTHYKAEVFSTDALCVVNGEYCWTKDEAPKRHKRNLWLATQAMEAGLPMVVIDNTNTLISEYRPYYEVGKKNGYYVVLVDFDTSLETCKKRNTHGVPPEGVEKLYNNIKQTQKQESESAEFQLCDLYVNSKDIPEVFHTLQIMNPSEKIRGFEMIDESLRENLNPVIPARSTKHAAGYDFHYAGKKPVTIAPGELVKLRTGIKAYMQDDEVLQIYPRSNMGKQRLMLANTVGVIDSDYYNSSLEQGGGEIMVFLVNTRDIVIADEKGYHYGKDRTKDHYITINPGDRICQGVFQKYLIADGDNADGIRDGGFGSTGK